MSIKRHHQLNLIIFISATIFVSIGTYCTIRWAKGYRPTKHGLTKATGLLAANSTPKGAQVYLNGHLTTATDDTLNLPPGEYQVEIKKDGYHPWQKKLTIEKELVTQTNATLFPTTPSLTPLTYTGALNPTPSPDGNKIAFAVASASATTKNGLYVQELSSNPLTLNKSAKQIARNTPEYDFAKATLTWSPDSSQIIASFPNKINLLLEADKFNDASTFKDVTYLLPSIFADWEREIAQTEKTKLKEFPEFMLKVATESATNVFVSPSGEKMLYQATQEIKIPDKLIPPIPAASTQPQARNLKPGNFYVYDAKEDRNFLVLSQDEATVSAQKQIILKNPLAPIPPAELNLPLESSSSPLLSLTADQPPLKALASLKTQYSSIFVANIQWFPDSYHLIITKPNSIDIIEYDGTNRTSIYSGPFDPSLVYPWPDGSKIITLIQFSPTTPSNLYSIKLK